MDLKYTDIDGIEQGELDGYSVDFSIGGSNDFAVSGDGSCLSVGCRLYETGTECGGIIRDRSSDTSSGTVTYIGDTWRGMLAQKIVEPDAGQDYYIVDGNVTDVLNALIVKCDLSDMYTANTPVDLNVKHQFNRYESLLDGITTMLSKYGYKLSIRCDGATVELYASEIRDLSNSVEVSQDGNYSFKIEQRTPVNHLIALGQGELKDRTVVHLYIQSDGSIGSSKFYTGIDEITEVYENTNAETVEDLTSDARKRFEEIISGSSSLELTVNDDVGADLGDIVGGRDYDTGIYIKAQIVEVIIKVEDGFDSKSYTVGSATSATSTRSTSGSGSSTIIVSGEGSNIKVDDNLSSTSTNPVQNKVVTNKITQIEKAIPIVDEALSENSTNAIQNKAVYEALKNGGGGSSYPIISKNEFDTLTIEEIQQKGIFGVRTDYEIQYIDGSYYYESYPLIPVLTQNEGENGTASCPLSSPLYNGANNSTTSYAYYAFDDSDSTYLQYYGENQSGAWCRYDFTEPIHLKSMTAKIGHYRTSNVFDYFLQYLKEGTEDEWINVGEGTHTGDASVVEHKLDEVVVTSAVRFYSSTNKTSGTNIFLYSMQAYGYV